MKDSWVKEFNEFCQVGSNWDENAGLSTSAVEDFIATQISLAEKRVERKWRDRIVNFFAGSGEYYFDHKNISKEEQKQIVKDRLSDLIKGE